MESYKATTVLQIGPYYFAEYMSLTKNEIVERFKALERSGYEIKSGTIDLGDGLVSFTNFKKLYDLINTSETSINANKTI